MLADGRTVPATLAPADYCANGGMGGDDNGLKSTFFVLPVTNVTIFRMRRATDVADGLSNTLMAAEPRVPRANPYAYLLDPKNSSGPLSYAWGGDGWNYAEAGFLTGHGLQSLPPASDWSSSEYRRPQFGSAHPTSMNAVFLDGSVRPIPYTIDPTIWPALCGINDGQVVPGEF